MRSDNTMKIALMSCMHSGGQQHAIKMTQAFKGTFFLFLEHFLDKVSMVFPEWW